MRKLLHISLVLAALLVSCVASAQADLREVRKGNRLFRKGQFKEAEISYRKALVKDSTSFAAGYNLASDLYRQENFDEADSRLASLSEAVATSAHGADWYFNKGDVAIAREDWQGAVDAFKQSLILRPGDMDAKENYIYAKSKLEQQQNGGGGDQNQDNQDQNNQDNQDNQDQNKDQDQNQNNQDQNRNQDGGNTQEREAAISPQQAQQMLQAIQAKERQTQDKVNREKAEALKSRQKEKNW